MDQDVKRFFDEVRGKIASAMAMTSDEVVEKIKHDLSVPYPPSGPAHQGPPAMRTGALRAGVHGVREMGMDRITDTFVSERVGRHPDVPEWLETGLPNMAPRPYMSNVFYGWVQDNYINRFAYHFTKSVT